MRQPLRPLPMRLLIDLQATQLAMGSNVAHRGLVPGLLDKILRRCVDHQVIVLLSERIPDGIGALRDAVGRRFTSGTPPARSQRPIRQTDREGMRRR